MKARGDSEEDIFKAIRKNRMERITSNNEFQKQVAKQNEALSNQFDLLQESGDLTKEKADEINALIRKNNESMIKAQEESKDLLEQIRIDDVNKAREAELEKARLEKEARDKKEQAEKKAANKRKAREDKEAADRKAREEKELAERLARLAKLAEEESKFIEDKTSLEDKYLESKISKEQQEINAVYDKYFAIIEAAKQYGEDTVLLEEAQQAAVKEIQDRYQAEREAAAQAERDAAIEADNKKKELAEAELLREQELQSAKLDLAGATLQGIGSLVNAFAGENEEQQRRAFNISKAISIAQATIDTYKGATAAFASTAASPLGIANPAAPFIAAAAAVAAGLANVATIARQQYQGGGSGGAGGGAGASNPPAELSNPATFNVVGNTGTNQLAQTLGQQPLQAYVVAGDVTSAQSLERNKIQQSTL
jgi:chemotaxis protein histidine kinase CheA